MASQRSKKTQSSQSKSSSGARHGGSTSNSSSKRQSGAHRNPDHAPSRRQPGRTQKSETRSSGASPSRASNGSRSRQQEPQRGMGEMMERVTTGAKEAGTKAVDSVKQHPVSAAMIGAGVAGLGLLAAKLVKDWASSDEGGQDQAQDRAGSEDMGEESDRLEDPGPDEAEDQYDPQGIGQQEGEQERDDQSGEEESGGGLMGRARDAWGAVRNGASSVGQSVEEGYEYGKDKLGTIWEDHPLAVSAGLLALGVAAGMLIPASRAEKKIFGRTSGKLTDKVVKAGRELFDQGSELAGRVITEAGTAIREEAEREGLSPDKLARKVKRIAGRIKDVISDAAAE